MSCGSSGDMTMYSPSRAASSVGTTFPSLIVYRLAVLFVGSPVAGFSPRQ